MLNDPHAAATRGALAAGVSFLLWGLWPLYWHSLRSVSSIELIAHRILWSLLLLLLIAALQGGSGELRAVAGRRALIGYGLTCGLLLAVNWTIYVWAVNNQHVIDSSLGYFLTPLCNVALGFALLHERLRLSQWIAVSLAAAGCLVLLFQVGHLPWIALSLTATWSTYGILKKRSALDPVPGLLLETMLLSPLAAAVLLWQIHAHASVFNQGSARLDALALASGVLTTAPLLLFAYGARRIRLATLGLLQYIAPSVQFALGLWLYREPMDKAQLHACLLIWCGLILYSADSFQAQRSRIRTATGPA